MDGSKYRQRLNRSSDRHTRNEGTDKQRRTHKCCLLHVLCERNCLKGENYRLSIGLTDNPKATEISEATISVGETRLPHWTGVIMGGLHGREREGACHGQRTEQNGETLKQKRYLDRALLSLPFAHRD